MRSKEELKKLFENGDKPTQEEFWEWQDSYWHKDEKLPETTGLYKIKGSVPNLTALHLMNSMSEGDVYNVIETGENYVYVLNLNNTGEAGWDNLGGNIDLSSETLAAVMNRGNIAPVELKFHDNAKLWYDLPTFSYYFNNGKSPTTTGKYNTAIGWGVLSVQTTGYENVGVGNNSLQNLTTGFYNCAFGNYALWKSTTAICNSAVGYASFTNTTTGTLNTGLGSFSGYTNTTGASNTYIGARSGQNCNGDKNVFIGIDSGTNHGKGANGGVYGNNTFVGSNSAYTSHATGTRGNNNVVIGSYAPLGGDTNNRLVIDSYTSAQRHDLVFPLIGGDFLARSLDFDASLKVRRLTNAEGDIDFTRQLVQKADGTIGYESKNSISNVNQRFVNTANTFSSSANLNTAYPDAILGFEVYSTTSGIIYKKITETNWSMKEANILA